MLTESEARDLLARAAATIEVPPGAPVAVGTGRPRRTLVPVMAAAAASALIIAAVALMQERQPGQASGPQVSDTAAPVASGIPSVFAYDADSAEQMLTDAGLVVTRKPSYTCLTPGRAVGTKPATGARFEPGDPVTLFVTEPSPIDLCIAPAKDALAWQLLDFANGRGLAPRFASEVTVYVNGQRTTLSGEEAADAGTWGPESALSLLATASRQVLREGGGLTTTPVLAVHRDDGTRFACGGSGLPDELAGRESLWLTIEIPTDGLWSCTFANLYRTDGQIDAIVVRTWGMGDAQATPEPEPDPDPDGIGTRFLAYARGEADELPVDTAVQLYLGNQYQKTISAADVSDRSRWDLCAPYAERSCPMSALTTLREFRQDPAVTDFLPDACLDILVDEPTDPGGNRMVVLGVPEPQSCMDDFAVQLWYDDVGQITAVNLLFGSP